jgi:hypothetical protein
MNYGDNEINLNNEICAQLAIDILNNKVKNSISILCVIVLKYNSIKDIIKKYDINTLEKSAKNVELKISNNNSKINVENIIEIFKKEYNKIIINNNNIVIIDINDNGERKNNILINNKINNDKDENIINLNNENEKDKNAININTTKPNNLKKMNYNIYWGQIDKILNKLKMDQSQYSELKKIFQNLSNLEVNSKKISNLEQEINVLKEENKEIKEENKEIKNMLYKMKFKDIAKKFLDSFSYYSILEEAFILKSNEKSKRYSKIINGLEKAFPESKSKRKFIVLKCLIKRIGIFLDDDYSLLYSEIKDHYKNDIDIYKKEKNLSDFSSKIFCFLKIIGLNAYFDESYDFMKKYFNDNFEVNFTSDPIRDYLN